MSLNYIKMQGVVSHREWMPALSLQCFLAGSRKSLNVIVIRRRRRGTGNHECIPVDDCYVINQRV